MSQDHIRLLVSIPPQVTSSRFVRLIEGKISHNLLSDYPHFRKTRSYLKINIEECH
ncbi:MAG: transposase [Candidatus Electronema sp. V4]|uniref:transposase n=1 Tax=Candidatus Electronema sp. V4 TaxID=3454756 RepID=UPI0040558ABA